MTLLWEFFHFSTSEGYMLDSATKPTCIRYVLNKTHDFYMYILKMSWSLSSFLSNLYSRMSKDLSVGGHVDGNFTMFLHHQNHQQNTF
jgi:hypothetical protein